MTDASARFALPFLQPGQAQKELYHNEALAIVDLAIQPKAQAIGVDDPPSSSPALGQCWVVGDAPSGAWVGQAGCIAGWTGGGWRFIRPVAGMMVWSAADSLWARYSGEAWLLGDLPVNTLSVGGLQVVGTRRPAIAAPAAGAVIDTEARYAVAAILSALRAHGLIAS